MSTHRAVLSGFSVFLDEARDAKSLQDLGRALVALGEELQYRHCVIVDVADLSAGTRRAVLFDSNGKESAEVYPAHYIGRRAEQNENPFTLDELRRELDVGSDDWNATLPDIAKEGVSLVLPVHRNGRCVLKVGCNGPSGDASPLARSMLHAAAHVVYDTIIALNESTPVRQLSAMEAECLRWMSLGKTNDEIAAIFNVSAGAVATHLSNAEAKLGKNSPLEALVRLAAEARRARKPRK